MRTRWTNGWLYLFFILTEWTKHIFGPTWWQKVSPSQVLVNSTIIPEQIYQSSTGVPFVFIVGVRSRPVTLIKRHLTMSQYHLSRSFLRGCKLSVNQAWSWSAASPVTIRKWPDKYSCRRYSRFGYLTISCFIKHQGIPRHAQRWQNLKPIYWWSKK